MAMSRAIEKHSSGDRALRWCSQGASHFFGEPFFGALACPAIADNLDNLSLSPSDETPMRTDRNLPNEPDTASRHEP